MYDDDDDGELTMIEGAHGDCAVSEKVLTVMIATLSKMMVMMMMMSGGKLLLVACMKGWVGESS